MKIAISTIAKNEAHNVKDFVASCKEADIVSVLDTGSTDGTISLLKKHNAYAGQEIIKPFDFAKARNAALDKLPDDVDVVVSIDMDERLQAGWRKELEKAWIAGTGAVSYWYISEWADEAKTIPSVACWRSKIFDRKKYRWQHCVHEVPLPADGSKPYLVNCDKIVVGHYQTGTRNYIELLTRLILEQPEEASSYIQRGADYIKDGNYYLGVKDYEQYIKLAREKQKEYQPNEAAYKLISGQMAHSFIEIGRAKMKMKYPIEQIIQCMLYAVAEAPDMREAWVYLADAWQSVGNYGSAYAAAMNALQVVNSGIYARELICWGEYPKNIADSSFAKIASGIVFENSVNKLK